MRRWISVVGDWFCYAFLGGIVLSLVVTSVWFLICLVNLLPFAGIWNAVSPALTWTIPTGWRELIGIACFLIAVQAGTLKLYLWRLDQEVKDRQVRLDEMTRHALGIEAWTDEALGQARAIHKHITSTQHCPCLSCCTMQQARGLMFVPNEIRESQAVDLLSPYRKTIDF